MADRSTFDIGVRQMLWGNFDKIRDHLDNQFKNIIWDTESGLSPEELTIKADKIVRTMDEQNKPRNLIVAELYRLILTEAQIAADPEDWFADKINHCGIIKKYRNKWSRQELSEINARQSGWSGSVNGSWRATPDFCHTCPDWERILKSGLTGLLEQIRTEKARAEENSISSGLQYGNEGFFEACEVVYESVIHFVERLANKRRKAAASEKNNTDARERMTLSAQCLEKIAVSPPSTLYEALQLSYIYYELHDEMDTDALDSMGGFDRLYSGYFESDLEKGLFTYEQEKELFKFFFVKAGASANRFSSFLGHSFYIGGIGPSEKDITSPFTYMVFEAYEELRAITPKISIRMTDKSPDRLLSAVVTGIRDKNIHYVLLNDNVAVKSFARIGISAADACRYAPIGCYEPAVSGLEVGCTGAAGISIAKAVELAIHNGVDPLTGTQAGIRTYKNTGAYETFEDFYDAVKKQTAYLAEAAMDNVRLYESRYGRICPAPLFSGTLAECLKKGKGAFEGGAKYNNTGLGCYFIGSAVDSISAVNKLVYIDKELSFPELADILKNNWEGHELLRRKIMADHDKWGNNADCPDRIAMGLSQFISGLILNKPNGRGGVFKPNLYAIIIRVMDFGKKTGALPDGRKAHEPLSQNLDAVLGMDRDGVTALINSAVKVDYTGFPNGSVLDVMLHPSVLKGKEGMESVKGLIRTYFSRGGFGIQFNVFDVDILRDAQKNPDRYSTLQVRVCGWNDFFVNLPSEQQDMFIKQADQA
ncbi:MAG: pyruvate formate lyase family protein [Eubacteriales bacterium]|nr:pyruvate formate lyase family protein [Eubacteriales bacterium]